MSGIRKLLKINNLRSYLQVILICSSTGTYQKMSLKKLHLWPGQDFIVQQEFVKVKNDYYFVSPILQAKGSSQ